MDHHNPVHAFFASGARVIYSVALADGAAVNAEEHQFAGKRIGPKLERQRTIRGVVIGGEGGEIFGIIHISAHGGIHVQRGGKIIDDRVHHRLHAFVFEGGTSKHRHHFIGGGEAADGALEGKTINGFLIENELHDLVVLVAYCLDQFSKGEFGFLLQLSRNFLHVHLGAEVIGGIINDRLLADDINDATQIVFRTNRDAHRVGVRAELLTHLGDHTIKVCTSAIHLVDEGNAGDAVLGGLPPHGFGLRLHAGHGAEDGDRAVEHAHGALHLGGEIHVAGGVDDVDAMGDAFPQLIGAVGLLRPKTCGGRAGNRDAPLALLFHPVGDGVAVVHLADFVREARVKQDALGGRGFAGINMRRNPDVPGALHCVLAVRRVQCFRVYVGQCFHRWLD